MTSKLPNRLPEFLYPYFWEIDPERFNPRQNDLYTIIRLLNRGNLPAIGWVLENFSSAKIKQALIDYRDWDRKAAYFWANYYHLPTEKVKCLSRSYQQKQKTFWPY